MRKQIRHRLADTGESFQAFVERLIAAELSKDNTSALAIQPQKLAAQVSQNLVRREKNDLPDNPAASLPGAGTTGTTVPNAVLQRIEELAEEIASHARSRHDRDQGQGRSLEKAIDRAKEVAEPIELRLEGANADGGDLSEGGRKTGKKKAGT